MAARVERLCAWTVLLSWCRFAGEKFPPVVLFKVYMSMRGRSRDRDHGASSVGLEKVRGVVTLPGRPSMYALTGGGGGVKYISGQKMITPHSMVL